MVEVEQQIYALVGSNECMLSVQTLLLLVIFPLTERMSSVFPLEPFLFSAWQPILPRRQTWGDVQSFTLYCLIYQNHNGALSKVHKWEPAGKSKRKSPFA